MLIILFVGIFAAYFGVSQGLIQVYVQNYVVPDTHTEQEKVDQSISSIFYELLLYNNVSLFSLDNLEHLHGNPADFSSVYASSFPNSAIIYGTTWYENGSYYSSKPSIDVLTSADRNMGITNSSNTLKFINVATYNSNYVLIFSLPVPNSNGNSFCFYFVDLEYCMQVTDTIGGENGYSSVIASRDDGTGQILFHKDRRQIGRIVENYGLNFADSPNYARKNVDDIETFAIYDSLKTTNTTYNSDWHIVTFTYAESIYAEFNAVYVTLYVFGAVVMLCLIAIIIVQLRLTLKPIKSLSIKVKNYKYTEKRKPEKVVDPKNEIASLENAYDDMVDRIDLLRNQLIEDMEDQRRLELDSLQIQINPHFLYNVLDAIAWMAKIKSEKEIETMVIELARFYRLSLHKGAKFITVEEELETIRHFFEIELFRYPNKFTYSFNISEEAKNEMTLKLILQPFVENSIKHGLLVSGKPGHISISASIDTEDYICLVIEDNGIGFDEKEAIAKNRNTLGGYGIHNVRERLRLQYNAQFDLRIESKKDMGTRVYIRIPKLPINEEN